MPITLLDLILLIVMLISGLLAMIRGFIREVLSIAAWALAAAAGVYGYAKLLPIAKPSFGSDIVAAAVVVGGCFLLTLLRVSDMILDSRVGALDRTLGFVFGLARGLVIVVVAFLFFSWLVPERGQPDWVRDAKSRVVLQGTGQWLMSMLPDDPESTILKRLKRPKGGEPEPQEAPQERSENRSADPEGYRRADRAGMQQLIQGSTKTR
jgi:membrane protein required for colicin V production